MTQKVSQAQVKVRSDRSQGRQLQYNQNASDPHGQPDGSWRVDCSGLTDAVFGISGSPSTYELVHSGFTSGPIDRSQVVPYKTITIVTNEDGFPFGHVAIVIGYDRVTDRLLIQEHGGGVGPDVRWLPSGLNYDSDRKYGRHRNFQLRNMLNVIAGTSTPPPVVIVKPTPGKLTPFPFPSNQYYGDIKGGNESHGGFNASEKAGVAAIQRVVGVNADGIYGPATIAAVLRWQITHKVPGITPTGKVGPQTWKAMGL